MHVIRFDYIAFHSFYLNMSHVTACDNGTYGADCMEFCGKCLDNEQCHHINGTCFSGCDPGYQGLNCTESKLL